MLRVQFAMSQRVAAWAEERRAITSQEPPVDEEAAALDRGLLTRLSLRLV